MTTSAERPGKKYYKRSAFTGTLHSQNVSPCRADEPSRFEEADHFREQAGAAGPLGKLFPSCLTTVKEDQLVLD